ncbi:tetratricopeptide repeat protein [uncultured Thalassolituus sp.]|uniref:tetratricopeptide repeat protein n=1 Tax=uncultured Thalassolituus sp. TaxID=285273 RepID=UPI0026207C2F|nr:tetratricopeptide repeat protein [uncultured Thalassolituus sp.]
MLLRLCALTAACLLTACAAPAPLLVAEAGAYKVAKYEEDIRVRAAAALRDEPDLLTYSVGAISRGQTEEAVATYLKGYEAPDYSDNMKSLALYQIGLIYMNRFNDDRDDAKAREYFQLHRKEYPRSLLSGRIQKHLEILNERDQSAVKVSATELLNDVNRQILLERPNVAYDDELNPMSERAIAENRTEEAEAVYLIVYENEASGAEIRAKALYQLGLIYMSPYNKSSDRMKALSYFRKIHEEFPDVSIREKVDLRITELLNAQ